MQEAVAEVSSEIEQLKHRLREAIGRRTLSQGNCGLCSKDREIARLKRFLTEQVTYLKSTRYNDYSLRQIGLGAERLLKESNKEKKINLAELKAKRDRIARQIDLTERMKALDTAIEINVNVYKKGGGPLTVFRFQNLNDVEQLKKVVNQFVTAELQRLEKQNEDMAR